MTDSVTTMTDGSPTTTQEESDRETGIAEVEEYLGALFHRVRQTWKEAAASIHPELQPVGYRILGAVVRLRETTAYALADLLDTDKSVVSRQIRMLEEAQLVTSRADEKDGRVRILSPTPEAVERVSAAKARQQSKLRDVLRTQPEADVRAFAGMLRLLSES